MSSSTTSPKAMSSHPTFDLHSTFKVEYSPSHITKYISRRTGLQLVIINQPSPLVTGYFTLATECPDDSGVPHTLEHLIFMGSKKYPYKGLLDTLGNVAYSNTNAWTATDQTVYTLTTSGWEGFGLLLPVYLDHLINPTLTDEACYTEVYHVDGEGEEKGVVFSEMSGIERQSWFVSGLESQRAVYHENSGYSSETGGLVENLRVLTNEKIREFHKQFYRAENLCIVVSGAVNETEFLKIMSDFDSELPDKDVNFKRPFVDSEYQINPLTETIVKEVQFAEKDEEFGELSLTWVGPSHSEWVNDLAVSLLLEYLCESSISLLTKGLIEIEEPLGSDLEFNTDDYTFTMPHITVNNVPTEKLHETKDRLLELLKEHCDVKKFNLQQMREVIENSKTKLIFAVEKSPEILTDYAITDFIYGSLEKKSIENLRTLGDYNAIAGWTVEQWVDLMKTYFIDNHPAIVIAAPSKDLYKANKAVDKKIKQDRLDKLGEEGLEDLKKKLSHAQEKNDAPIPEEILNQFTKPSPSNIELIKTQTIAVGLNNSTVNDPADPVTAQLLKDTPADFPLYVNYDHFESQFISVDILLSSHVIPESLLPYFELYQELFNLSMNVNGEYIDYETIVKQIQNDTVLTGLYAGFDNQFSETITLKIQALKSNYVKVVEWIGKVMYDTVWEESRVKVLIERVLNSLPSLKRDGSSMLSSLQTRHCFGKRSLHKARDFIESEGFYRGLLEKLEAGEFEQIKAELEQFRAALFQLSNFRIVIAGDLTTQDSPISTWSTHFLPRVPKSAGSSVELQPIPRSNQVFTPLGKTLSNQAKIISSPTATATYLIASTCTPTTYRTKDSVSLAVASSYLQAVEGPFWRGIRGTGLAYGANISRNVEFGRLSFDVYRGADAKGAFEVAKKIIDDIVVSGGVDDALFQGAVSSLISGIANSESNSFASAAAKFNDVVLKGRGDDYNQWFMKELESITKEDMVNSLKADFQGLFQAHKSAVFICCHPEKVSELSTFLESEGYAVEVEEATVGKDDDEEEYDDDEEEEEGDYDEDDDDDEEEETDSEDYSSDEEE
ncbi:hypothetical protein WICPIJ_005117 [Wickerhamomyces pijperi]|uniref:Mitochondrial presequence protease n=1 Tax=Wickerhamomyces pijperi TaxID=599730 RepID=A0A9P8Q4P2_WICPI|nr:hypothetical protein WICPIJ_005117 [Wickerhamomyces pijperi]